MRKHRSHNEDETEVDMTPMLDIVFIMLIFFIVTTSFVKEDGIELNRPAANPPETPNESPTRPILIEINENSEVSIKGRMIDVKAIDIAGEFENAFFIDHVETEWCYRAASLGVKLYGIPDAEMQHQMGEKSIKFWLFGQREMPYRVPIRHYYLFRNSMVLQNRSYVPITWKIWNIAKLTLTFAYFILFSPERKEQAKNMKRGILEGIKRGKKNPVHIHSRS